MDLKSWYRYEKEGVAIYRAWNLESTGLVHHGFTTRTGGVSGAPYDTLNLGLHVNDNEPDVIANRAAAAGAVGVSPAVITTAEQVHGSAVAVVTPAEAGRGSVAFSDCIPGVDALITDVPRAALTLFYADCVPVFILDPEHRAIAIAHAGWKGTAGCIVAHTVEAMTQTFGSDPASLLAAVGPAISRCCYDVSRDVAEKIRDAAEDERVIARATQEHWRLDLKFANWLILRRSGLAEANIAVSDQCTCCNPRDFFSYRRDGQTGRMAAIMALSH